MAEGVSIAEGVAYDELVVRVLQFVIEAALARAADRFGWEQEQLRRDGLRAIQFARDGRALWWDGEAFAAEEAGALRMGERDRFVAANEIDPGFWKKLDRDLRTKLRRAGYATGPLILNMRGIFKHIAAEAEERSAHAQTKLVEEILGR